MNTTYQDNGDGTYSKTTTETVPFDPTALQSQISDIEAQMAAAVSLATSNATVQFQPQIDTLTASIAAFNAAIPNPSQPVSGTDGIEGAPDQSSAQSSAQ